MQPPEAASQFRAAYRRHPFASGLALLLAVAAAAATAAPELAPVLAQPLVPLASVVAGLTGLRDVQRVRERRQRLPWILISIGYLAASVGVAAFVVASAFSEVGAFGMMDLPIIAGYGLLMAGLLSQPQLKESRSHQVRVLIDGAIGAVSVATVLWIWFIGDLLATLATAPTWHRIVGAAYPTLDVLGIVVVMIIFLRRSPQRFDVRLLLVAMGFMCQVAADLTFLLSGAGKSFDEAMPNYALFLLAFVFFLGAAVIAGDVPPPREYAERVRTPWWPMIVPYGWSAVMVAVLALQVRAGALSTDLELLLIATLFVGGLVVMRQFVAIHENRQIVERERRALISTISHELRTPLTAMVGFLDLICRGDEIELPAEEQEDLIQVVDQQARYLSRIVSDLVLLARGTSDSMELERSDVRIDQVVQQAVTAMDTGLNDVQVLVPTGLTANLDGDRLQQALVNLLSNAIRYGGDERLIEARVDGADLTIAVHDNGPGVPKRYELSIWERFERGANRLNSSVPGSGIGLAIVTAIASAHGGSTQYRRSEILEGACFSVHFPNVVRAQQTGHSENPKPQAPPAPARAGSGFEQVGEPSEDPTLIR